MCRKDRITLGTNQHRLLTRSTGIPPWRLMTHDVGSKKGLDNAVPIGGIMIKRLTDLRPAAFVVEGPRFLPRSDSGLRLSASRERLPDPATFRTFHDAPSQFKLSRRAAIPSLLPALTFLSLSRQSLSPSSGFAAEAPNRELLGEKPNGGYEALNHKDRREPTAVNSNESDERTHAI